MSTLLKSAAFVLCAGVSCAQATETANQGDFNIGAMYEIENVEGQGDDKYGLTGGFRNYGYHFKDEHGAKDGSANMQRYKIQPDWDIKLTDDWRFGGWLSLYQFANDLEKTGYADSRVETETGFTWTLNETFSAKVNYYLERGFNMDS